MDSLHWWTYVRQLILALLLVNVPAGAALVRVDRLYSPEMTNFSPRVGLAWDPTGTGRTSIRTGFSMAYQPHHGQSDATRSGGHVT